VQYYGFKEDWTLAGLKSYFEKHSQQPVGQYVPHCAEHPMQAAPVRGEASHSEELDLQKILDRAESCQ
jgi:hypothetical protein